MRKALKRVLPVLALLAAAALLLVACVGDPDATDNFPTGSHDKRGLGESDLSIEWLGENGESVPFEARKPVAILFHSQTAFSDKETMTLSESDYFTGDQGTLAYATTKRNLSWYWRKMGYNVGIFHYENFVDYADSTEQMMDKAFTRVAPYRDDQGNVVNRDLPQLSLLDVFWDVWAKTVSGQVSIPLSGKRGFEVRLIGNGIGANIALAAADYCYTRNAITGELDPAFLPVRVTAINPVYSGTEHAIQPVYAPEDRYKTVTEALEGCAKKAEEAGVVLEFIEENPPTESTESYRAMIARGAHLHFEQTFTENMAVDSPARDRAALSWYLLSVGGSDAQEMNSYNVGYGQTLSMFDDAYGGYSNSMVRYALCAWTPTPYTRAQKGLHFTMERKEYSSEAQGQVYVPKIMAKLAAESYQRSDMRGANVVGYAFLEDDEKTAYINYGKRLGGVQVRLTVYQSSQSHPIREYTTRTDANGFYSITLDTPLYASDKTYSYYLDVAPPSSDYVIANHTTNGADYLKLEMSTLGSDSNQVTLSINSRNNLSQTVVRSVAFRSFAA